ncbi:MAG: sulfatase [Planctomycetota bacterium]
MTDTADADRRRLSWAFLARVAAVLALVCPSARAELPDLSKMNILFICPEDWSAEAIGVYRNAQVLTPNLDKFAESAIVFTRAYNQNPVCNPSRSSFLTGLRSDTTQVYSNPDKFEQVIPEWATTIGEALRDHQIKTYMVGKLFHHNWEAVRQASAFDGIFNNPPDGYQGRVLRYQVPPGTPPNPEKSWTYTSDPEWDAKMIEAMAVRQELWAKHPKGSEGWHEGRRVFQDLQAEIIGDSGRIEERSPDGIRARVVANLIREHAESGEQFFITFGSGRPHTPLIAPQKYFDLYDPDLIELSPASPDLDRNIPDVAKRFGNNWDIFKIREQTPKLQRAAVHAYYACASFIDDQIGLMLDALEESGQAENTIVIFTSDHGFHLGEHGMWSKISLFEQSTRVPFIIRIPGVTDGQTSDAIIELVDLYPTLCDILNIPHPHDRLEGMSILPLIHDPNRDWKRAAFTICRQGAFLGRSVRTASHRYTEWTTYEDRDQADAEVRFKELYELESDPYEHVNLADKSDHAELQAELAGLLESGWRGALPASGVQ